MFVVIGVALFQRVLLHHRLPWVIWPAALLMLGGAAMVSTCCAWLACVACVELCGMCGCAAVGGARHCGHAFAQLISDYVMLGCLPHTSPAGDCANHWQGERGTGLGWTTAILLQLAAFSLLQSMIFHLGVGGACLFTCLPVAFCLPVCRPPVLAWTAGVGGWALGSPSAV